MALWWYNRVRRPGVDLEGFGEPYFARLRDHLAASLKGNDLFLGYLANMAVRNWYVLCMLSFLSVSIKKVW